MAGRVGAIVDHIGEGVKLEREGVGVCDVPVKGVELAGGHSIKGAPGVSTEVAIVVM